MTQEVNPGSPAAVEVASGALTPWGDGALLTLNGVTVGPEGGAPRPVAVFVARLDQKIAVELADMLMNLVASFKARPKKD